jgi:hypothetical protein
MKIEYVTRLDQYFAAFCYQRSFFIKKVDWTETGSVSEKQHWACQFWMHCATKMKHEIQPKPPSQVSSLLYNPR